VDAKYATQLLILYHLCQGTKQVSNSAIPKSEIFHEGAGGISKLSCHECQQFIPVLKEANSVSAPTERRLARHPHTRTSESMACRVSSIRASWLNGFLLPVGRGNRATNLPQFSDLELLQPMAIH
jgi:hypothetical protein